MDDIWFNYHVSDLARDQRRKNDSKKTNSYFTTIWIFL